MTPHSIFLHVEQPRQFFSEQNLIWYPRFHRRVIYKALIMSVSWRLCASGREFGHAQLNRTALYIANPLSGNGSFPTETIC